MSKVFSCYPNMDNPNNQKMWRLEFYNILQNYLNQNHYRLLKIQVSCLLRPYHLIPLQPKDLLALTEHYLAKKMLSLCCKFLHRKCPRILYANNKGCYLLDY